MFDFIKSKSDKNKSRLKLSKPSNNILKYGYLKYKVEAIAILLVAVFFILFLSLLSYNPTDSSWFYFSNSTVKLANWCGVIGANFSALLFYLFGKAAYLFVAGFAFFAYVLFTDKLYNKKNQYLNRIVAFLLLTSSFAAILFAYNIGNVKTLAGGLVGSSFFDLMVYPLGQIGSKIFHFSIVLSSVIVVGRISFFTILKQVLYVTFSFLKLSFITLTVFLNYLFKTIKVVGRLAGRGLWSFTKFVYSKCKSWIRFIFKKTKKEASTLNVSSDSQEVGGAQETSFDFYENRVTAIHPKTESVIEKFKDKVCFKSSHKVSLDFLLCHPELVSGSQLDLNFLLLPNTIFNKNIFERSFAIKLFGLILEKTNKKDKQVVIENSITDVIKVKPKIEYTLPDTKIFEREDKVDEKIKKELEAESVRRGELLEEKLSYFGIKGKVTAIRPGPVITLFEYKPEIDSKISKIISLEDDLALALMAISIRIVAPIPGRSVVGFEISNKTRQKVFLSTLLNSKEFKKFEGRLPIIFGVDIVGNTVIQDLAGMPHLLVAGSTGSGKSVGMNAMLVSLLCNFSPDELKLILIDPKRLEFAPYKDIPHLLFPIITNPRSAAPVLKWLVQEMERRYDQLAEAGVRNISEYQELSNPELTEMPFIVLMIDELADLMMVAGKDVELHIARVAQMARAAGIHMVVATQRPSVDVVTGLIKVNFPSRIAFRVTSKIDSRTIVDGPGAEKLLGRGDMLYMNSASSDLQRIHGAYVGVKEVEKLASHLKAQAKAEYLDLNETLKQMNKEEVEIIEDKLYPEVVKFIRTIDELSISGLQRKYRIGFNRSARLIERLELDGFLAPQQGSKPRRVLKENC